MSTVGVFLLLLAAFVLLSRWYIRPQRRARRAAAARGAAIDQGPARRERAPRDNPGDPGREPDAAAGHGAAGVAGGAASTASGIAGGGASGGAGASGSIDDGGAGDGD
jgi:uncharacterized membrane protein YgcG